MKIKSLIAAAATLVASSAHATGTLSTPPLYDNVGLLLCSVVNVSPTTVNLIVEARDADGGIVDKFGPVDLPPHAVTGDEPLVSGTSTCAFVVLNGKPAQLRGAANYRDQYGNMVIMPAR
jgi:hypothetical protein